MLWEPVNTASSNAFPSAQRRPFILYPSMTATNISPMLAHDYLRSIMFAVAIQVSSQGVLHDVHLRGQWKLPAIYPSKQKGLLQ